MKQNKNQYPGGKNSSGTYQQIINWIPEIDVYIELFTGSGAIARNMKLPALTVLLEKDSKQFKRLKETVSQGIVLINTDSLDWLHHNKELINYAANMGVRIHIYADPPYPKSVRRSQRDIYNHEMTDEQHINLCNDLAELKCTVQLSSYQNPIYDEILHSWSRREYEQQLHVGTSTESVYYNYEQPIRLQDYRYIGNDYRKREALKRSTINFMRKLQNLPQQQQNLILQLLQDQKTLS